jgi:predicted ATP-grasp superfamily ATP-dependent carboligase
LFWFLIMGLDRADNQRLQSTVKTLATLGLLLLVLPLNLGLTSLAVLIAGIGRFRGRLRGQPRAVGGDRQTILISGGKMTKALQLARSFHGAGHRVILVEYHKYWLTGHRFSWSIDRFYTVPNPTDPSYIEALRAIVMQEKVDVYVPVCSPVASYYDALSKQALGCEVMQLDVEQVEKLDDKATFSAIAHSLGLSVPDFERITDRQQVIDFDFSSKPRPYILKSIPYDSVRRLDLTKLPCDKPEQTVAFLQDLPISAQTPWIMQAFIPGQEYCTHSTVRDGELRLHCCCESSAFQINYENVDHPAIEAWVRTFVGRLNLTGQVSLDFMQADDGEIYAIECNPRTHSAITMFYNHPDVAEAYLGRAPLPAPIQPLPTSRPTYWIYHEIWRLVTNLGSVSAIQKRLKIIIKGKDAIFDWSDPLPFLMVHHAQIPWLLLGNLRQMKGWVRIDFNIGKLVESAGD